ncbi:hypothetical protein KUTeg_016196 [Tegillarca granosa]|uniref:GIY-YIG domain-containing protein n=1 Tax=Tegillarca granosa TaxID=220873 RepID=A0ABQ9EP11_TEGGR|nr:hypothetical protein KUTeg_016196 [Tegillarca granosa]
MALQLKFIRLVCILLVLLLVISMIEGRSRYHRRRSSTRHHKSYKKAIDQNRRITNLPKRGSTGLYAIKYRGKVIYGGQSKGHLRRRLQKHLSGRDGQHIGQFIKGLSKSQKKHLSIDWTQVKNPDKKERGYLKYISRKQRKWPKYNRKQGDHV